MRSKAGVASSSAEDSGTHGWMARLREQRMREWELCYPNRGIRMFHVEGAEDQMKLMLDEERISELGAPEVHGRGIPDTPFVERQKQGHIFRKDGPPGPTDVSGRPIVPRSQQPFDPVTGKFIETHVEAAAAAAESEAQRCARVKARDEALATRREYDIVNLHDCATGAETDVSPPTTGKSRRMSAPDTGVDGAGKLITASPIPTDEQTERTLARSRAEYAKRNPDNVQVLLKPPASGREGMEWKPSTDPALLRSYSPSRSNTQQQKQNMVL